MESTNSVEQLINYSQQDLIKFIKNNKDFNFNIKDKNNNYFIQQIIIKNYPLVFHELFNYDIEFDIIDKDSRSILYYIIRFNRTKFLDIILNNIDKLIGISIFNIKDTNKDSAINYTLIYNNTEMFIKLYKSNKINIFTQNKNGDYLLHSAIKYKNNKIINFLLDNNFPTNKINNNHENILHYFSTFMSDSEIFYELYKDNYKLLEQQEKNFGLAPIHLITIKNQNIINKIIFNKNNINITDFYGNTPLHYLILEKHHKLFNKIYNNNHKLFNHNSTNINGQTILHLFSDINNNDDNMKNLINNTNLDIQDINGNTNIHQIIFNNINKDFLKNNIYNIYILNTDSKTPIDLLGKTNWNTSGSDNKKELITFTAKNFSNILEKNTSLAQSKWEKTCSQNNDCFNKIFNYMIKEKRNPPFTKDKILEDITIENNVPVKFCQYIGNTLDILFNLLFLNKQDINLVLDIPLTENKELSEYFQTLGIDLSFKTDFINIQIFWAYNKLFLPTFFKDNINNIKKHKKYTIIPLGIEMEQGGHANIIIIDHKNKIIERFEPNGANPPSDFNYNSLLLDGQLKDLFEELKYSYLAPKDYLPPIGFQMLESMEMTCQVGDPNGFCAVWCTWWVYHKIINKQNINSKLLAEKLIHKIKINNYSFKAIIRNFSTKITELRDNVLEKYNLNINKYIQGKYTDDTINKIEKYIIKQL